MIWKLVEKHHPADYEIVLFKGAASDMTKEKVKNLRKTFDLSGVCITIPGPDDRAEDSL